VLSQRVGQRPPFPDNEAKSREESRFTGSVWMILREQVVGDLLPVDLGAVRIPATS
jgi:hypothetical protein